MTMKNPESSKTSQPRGANKLDRDLAPNAKDVIDLILRDHVALKNLILVLQSPDKSRAQKAKPYEEFATLLTNHARAEEKSLYVSMKDVDKLKMPSFEGDTAHALAHQLVQEINATPDDNEWLAKVKVLADSVEHHIEVEETDMLAKVEASMSEETRRRTGALYEDLKNEMDELNLEQPPKTGKIKENRLNS